MIADNTRVRDQNVYNKDRELAVQKSHKKR